MPANPQPKPSFSPRRKWSIGFNVFLMVVLVLAVVVMLNVIVDYLSRDYRLRFQWSNAGRIALAPRTVNVVKSLTNQVKVTLYYNKEEPLYSTVVSLLNEYKLLNPKITVQTVDFIRDTAAAQKIKSDYKLGAATDKNLVIFDCEGKVKSVDGNALAEYTLEKVPDQKENSFRRKATAFKGEMMFTAVLMALSGSKPFKAYFLEGHGEHRTDSGDEAFGYMKFASVLQQIFVQYDRLSLSGTNPVPMDCNLLIIAGPTTAIPENELASIGHYLSQGGRLLALFNAESVNKPTGLEKILAAWGVAVHNAVVLDPDHSEKGSDVIVSAFTKHPLVNPLLGKGLYLIRPRVVSKTNSRSPQPADAPQVEAVAFSSPQAFYDGDPAKQPHQFPLIVAVEKGAIKGVSTERGTTRMIVAGESLFLANGQIDSLANRDFADYAANWLLDRTELLEGVGPKPLPEYKIIMTKAQLQRAQWLLLAGMPGSVLTLGGMVWLRRRR
jgi:hypothetical protein